MATSVQLFVEIHELKVLKGLALQDILTELHLLIHQGLDWFNGMYHIMLLLFVVEFPANVRMLLLDKMATTE